MAKRNRRGSQEQHGKSRRDGFIEDVALAEAARSRYLNYALSVITSRALPDVRDGLKPVQRRILYAMWSDLHLSADSRYIKSAAVVGEVMKTYHPHGDQSIYDALVRMAQPFSLRHPVIEGYGNFGSIDGDPPAAMRYTECRLTPIAQALLSELRDQTVNLRPNYASTAFEPEVLPAQFPNLLVNGASGIAVGMATNIPPHNLKEVCTALVALLDNRELPLDRLLKHIHGPDFPTGGVILNSAEEIRQIYATGQGSIKLRGTYEPHPDRHNAVLITSIPYGIEKDALVERIGELIGKGQVPQLVNVKDLSTDDIRIVLELRPGSSPDAALAYLFKNTPLQVNYNVNLTCLLPAAGAEVAVPSRLDLTSILQHFLDFRMDVVVRRLRFELKNLLERIHILEGFAIVFKNLDEAIQIIRNSDGKADAAPKLIRRFELSEIQADAVLETKLYKLGKLEIRDILERAEAEAEAGRRDQDPARRRTGAVGDHQGRAQADQQDLRRAATNQHRGSHGPDGVPRGRLHRGRGRLGDRHSRGLDQAAAVVHRCRQHPAPRQRHGGLGLSRPRPADHHLFHRSRDRLHPPGQRHPAHNRPWRADPETICFRGSGAHRRGRLPRPALFTRSQQAPPDSTAHGAAAVRRRCGWRRVGWSDRQRQRPRQTATARLRRYPRLPTPLP